jgi:hypothetical protein
MFSSPDRGPDFEDSPAKLTRMSESPDLFADNSNSCNDNLLEERYIVSLTTN